MKTKIILLALLFSGITFVFISMNIFQITTGPHGGNIKQVDDFNIEMKIPHPDFYAYLLNKQCKPINNKGVSGEIRFFFPDSTSLDIPLQPYEEDGFRMESSVLDYYSYRVTFHAFGKFISAKFENENAIARKK